MTLIKYQCHTVGSALDLVAYVSDRGGNVCVIMNGFDATRTVLTDYPFSNKDDEEAHDTLGILASRQNGISNISKMR